MAIVERTDVVPDLLWQAKEALAALDRRTAAPDGRSRVAVAADRLLIACEFPSLLRAEAGEPERFAVLDAIGDRNRDAVRHRAAWALAGCLLGDPGLPDPPDGAGSALASCPFSAETASAVVAAVTALVHGNHLEAAISWCDWALPQAARLATESWSARLLAVRAEASLHRGDVLVALARAEAALETAPPERRGAWIGGPLACLIAGHTDLGELDAARGWARRPVPAPIYETRHCLGYLYARGHHHLADGEHRSALADFMSCGRLLAYWGLDPDLYPWRLAAAAAYLGLGDHDAALTMVDAQLAGPAAPAADVVQAFGRPGARSRRRQEQREELFGILQESAGRPGLYSRLRLLQWGDLPGAVPHRVVRYKVTDRYAAALDELSPSEQRVALLAARGETNQRIARALSITVSTVEQHLTRIYRKLRVNGRGDLRRKLG
ncbi:helix-turn-helix transcriptional regulator [Kitasatospora cathayae]|uniref:Helix-turn-helix transcriptional regulator n=1 Tax=Kitasatospora cathayae TaxID=3004092 RepID=A0ABY7QB74_9ACTN|nr:helix-turn-helix transcriptional regulator [Kitasatospora sp. HUAS 3-15]WBP90013.1 helix-turn-helix transcriptional regulator [Kitasatospora sp. HUAS 3-15]